MSADSNGAPGTERCRLVLARLDAFLDGELTADQDTEVREHLAVCDRCRQHAEHQRAFLARLDRIEGRGAPEGLRDRIRARLRDQDR